MSFITLRKASRGYWGGSGGTGGVIIVSEIDVMVEKEIDVIVEMEKEREFDLLVEKEIAEVIEVDKP